MPVPFSSSAKYLRLRYTDVEKVGLPHGSNHLEECYVVHLRTPKPSEKPPGADDDSKQAENDDHRGDSGGDMGGMPACLMRRIPCRPICVATVRGVGSSAFCHEICLRMKRLVQREVNRVNNLTIWQKDSRRRYAAIQEDSWRDTEVWPFKS
ncbi:hypothetical protein NUW54_g8269 [Trametes sanguinea]|uniref:Uncharacterized protein n=1 Tax=Trametes sanguinea TaxID=158606 RepID=A0ACC1PHF6_9APHY|nr:hypothetical protein NUW54_g8269 [Trametes sanguinea]